MTSSIGNEKRVLRKRLRESLRSLSPEEKATQSQCACRLLEAQAIWKKASTVLLYSPLSDEVDITPLLHSALAGGKAVSLPRYEASLDDYRILQVQDLAKDLVPGHYGILEPAPHCSPPPGKRLDFILVPGLGFDCRGKRLGRGKGYYDRLLQAWNGVRCGIGFDCQLCEAIPAEPHDEILKLILTPTRWIVVSPEGGG